VINKLIEYQPFVSVVMITYNQEIYINEAIKVILEQEVAFTLELIIADDCSHDGTPEIVQEFIDSHSKGHFINYVRHKCNKGVMPNFLGALRKAKGKYIALCEGDDYWTDPLKLQKQVDFLEANTECNYIFTNRSTLKLDGSIYPTDYNIPELFDLHFLLKQNIMPSTQTVMFRSSCLSQLDKWEETLRKGFNGDWILLFMITQNSKIGFLKDNTAVYREGVGVISRTISVFKLINGLETNKRINNLTDYKYDNIIGGFDYHYRNITYSFLEEKNRLKGVSWFFKTEWYKLLNPKRNSIFSKTNVLFIKHSFKLFFGFKI
jgi:glycosyltransferase involved in cell wall biosynthesis